jgi:hypothetical protein
MRKKIVTRLFRGSSEEKCACGEQALEMSRKFMERNDEVKEENGRQQKGNCNCVLWMKVLN